MPVPLLPGQFDLGGYIFGRAEDPVTVLAGGWDRGGATVRDQDVPHPSGDGMLLGRDRLTPGVWSFDLLVHDEAGVGPHLAELAAAWRADGVRGTPGAVVPLRYRDGDDTRIVWGRPRRFQQVAQKAHDQSYRVVAGTFQLVDVNTYSDSEQLLVLGLVTTSVGTGVVLPAVLPWVLGEPVSTTRRGMVVVGGTVPTPVRIVIQGPASGTATDVVVSAPGWRVALTDPVPSGQTIVIDTGLGTMTRDGVPTAGITRDSSLALRIPPGVTELTLTAGDLTATLTATVYWRAADPLT